jgi:hypothetical protein
MVDMELLSWGALALIHAAPGLAFFKPSLITKLYGVELTSPLFPLLHHRSALFLNVVLSCTVAAFSRPSRLLAAATTAVSMVSFLGIFLLHGQQKSLKSIAMVDLAGLPALVHVLRNNL